MLFTRTNLMLNTLEQRKSVHSAPEELQGPPFSFTTTAKVKLYVVSTLCSKLQNVTLFRPIRSLQCNWYRRDSAVVRASALQSVDLVVHFSSRIIPKDFKKWYLQLPSWALSKIGIVWRTSWQACLLCPWARHLTGCLHLLCGRQVEGPSSLPVVVAQSN